MSETLVLREYESRTVALPSPQASRLADRAGSALAISPTPTPGEWQIAATSAVGSIVLPGLQVLIQPKVRLRNLFALLDAGMPEEAWQPEIFGYGDDRQVLAAFAAFYARMLDRATATGLVRAYRADADRLPALRGRTDFPEQLRRPGLPSPIACRYDEYTADVPENQYLLGATDHLLRVPGIDPRTRSLLQHARGRFEGVASVLPTTDELDAIAFTRLNEHYRPIVRLSRFVVEHVSLADRVGATGASSFLLDMNQLFEDWVTRSLRRALGSRLVVIGQAKLKLDTGGKVSIAPDLEFRRRDESVYVGDVKYKLASGGLARSSDYYQLLAYCTSLGLPEGVLIYAQTDGATPEREVVVRHAGTRLWTYRLDLGGDAGDLVASVGRLADWIADRAVRSTGPLRAGGGQAVGPPALEASAAT